MSLLRRRVSPQLAVFVIGLFTAAVLLGLTQLLVVSADAEDQTGLVWAGVAFLGLLVETSVL